MHALFYAKTKTEKELALQFKNVHTNIARMCITIQTPVLHQKCENKMIAEVTTSKSFMSTEAEITSFHLILWWLFQILQNNADNVHCYASSGNNTNVRKGEIQCHITTTSR